MAAANKILFNFVFAIVCNTLTNAIVDGNFVEGRMFPFMVLLFDNRFDTHVCGGSILNERYILSAAVCFSYYESHPQHLSATIGTNWLMGGNGVTKNISSVVRHPMYGIPKYHNDLALLKTLDQIVFTEFIKPVVLPTESFNGVDKDVQICGFGNDFVSIQN